MRDSIAVRYVVGYFRLPGGIEATSAGSPIAWAPDGRHFFFIARHGELSCDCNNYALYVFNAQQLERALAASGAASKSPPQPDRKIVFSSSRSDPFFQGISEPRWESNESILFFGVRGGGPRHVYRLDIATGATTQLSGGSRDVIAYAAQGPAIVYSVREHNLGAALDDYPVHVVADDDLRQLGAPQVASFELLTANGGADAVSLGGITPPLLGPWMSPDGGRAIVATQSNDVSIPPAWADYEVRPRSGARSAARFFSIDMAGRLRPLLDAPLGAATRAGWNSAPDVLWFSDGKRALLINTALPLDERAPERRNTPYIVEVDLQSGRWIVLDHLTDAANGEVGKSVAQIVTVDWLQPDRAIRVNRQLTAFGARDPQDSQQQRAETSVYVRGPEGWTRSQRQPKSSSQRTARSIAEPRLKVVVRQSANDPPLPTAIAGRRELPLLEPDPALSGVRRATVRPVQWRESGDRTVTGGLILPAEYGSAARVPLVIQASAYSPHLFLPDGTSTTAFAAQALASAGMAVLLIDIPAYDPSAEWRRSVMSSTREAIAFVERIDAAVASLATQFPIDPTRVGLIGFSRSGFMSYYSVTHPGKLQLAAAVIADPWTASYGEYVVDAATSTHGNAGNSEFEAFYGSGTFWKNKDAWLEHAPLFNVDRVVTPVLFTVGGKFNNLLFLETVGAFRLNRRPFEYLTLRDGAHQLQRPRERLASLGASVDWMDFWLRGREDPDPRKVGQYERWTAIKTRWERTRQKEGGAGAAVPTPALSPQ